MKKMLSLLMALLMLVLCTATAETTAETQTVLSPNGSYSLDVPADCIVMNGESMAELITSDAMAELMTQLFGLESASELEAYLAQLDAANMLCIYISGLKGCINTQTSAASMTMEQMTAMKSLLDEAISQQYVQMGFKQEDIVYQEMETVGDYTLVRHQGLHAGRPGAGQDDRCGRCAVQRLLHRCGRRGEQHHPDELPGV